MMLEDLQAWAQAQVNNTAQPTVRPDVGISVLQMVEELEDLKAYVAELEARLKVTSKQAS
jgi:hypothetical protein